MDLVTTMIRPTGEEVSSNGLIHCIIKKKLTVIALYVEFTVTVLYVYQFIGKNIPITVFRFKCRCVRN